MNFVKLKLDINGDDIVIDSNDIVRWFGLNERIYVHCSTKDDYKKLYTKLTGARRFLHNPVIQLESISKIQLVSDLKLFFAYLKVGSIANELLFKLRDCFTCFSYDPRRNEDVLYSGLENEWGEEVFVGYCNVLQVEKVKSYSPRDIVYKMHCEYVLPKYFEHNSIKFDIYCMTVQGVLNLWDSFEGRVPTHLLYSGFSDVHLKTFIESEISLIRFSSFEELLLKINCISSSQLDLNICMDRPITKGEKYCFEVSRIC